MGSPSPDSLVQMMLQRLERVSVDSYWAHRASGIRGALLRSLEQEDSGSAADAGQLQQVIEMAFQILEEAAPSRRRGVGSAVSARGFVQRRG